MLNLRNLHRILLLTSSSPARVRDVTLDTFLEKWVEQPYLNLPSSQADFSWLGILGFFIREGQLQCLDSCDHIKNDIITSPRIQSAHYLLVLDITFIIIREKPTRWIPDTWRIWMLGKRWPWDHVHLGLSGVRFNPVCLGGRGRQKLPWTPNEPVWTR